MRLALLIGIPISIWATHAAWRGPPPPPMYPSVPIRSRPTSPAALSKLQAQATEISQEIQAASERAGHPLSLSELEGSGTSGTPALKAPIPDNPLMPDIATVSASCEPLHHPVTTDWTYCAETGVISANVPHQAQYGNE
jgi:hypothetical protein